MSATSWKLTYELEKPIFDEDDITATAATSNQNVEGGLKEKAKV